MNDKDLRLDELSKKTGIPVFHFKHALGIPPSPQCNAKTIAEVQTAYRETSPGTEAQAAVLSRWNELSLQEVSSAETVAEAREAYGKALHNSEAQAVALLRWISLAETVAEVQRVYKIAPDGSKAQTAALKKMVELFEKEELPA